MKFLGKYSRLNNEEQSIRLAIINWGIDHGGEIPWVEAIALAKQYAPDSPELSCFIWKNSIILLAPLMEISVISILTPLIQQIILSH